MSKNIKNGKNKKIIAATGMTIFSLLAVFTATIAWFVLNQNVKGTGMAVKAHASGPSFSSITVHKAILGECTSTQYVFSKTPINPSQSTSGAGSTINIAGDIIMDQYSDLGPSQPILLLFTLPDNTMIDNNIYLEGLCTYTGTSAQYLASLTGINANNVQKLSSIVTFYGRTSVASSDYFAFGENDITFSRNSSYLSTSSFVTTNNSNGGTITAFNNTIEMYDGNDINKGTTGEAEYIKYVAIVMDYNQEAINYIYRSDVNNGLGEVHYAIDWKMNMR